MDSTATLSSGATNVNSGKSLEFFSPYGFNITNFTVSALSTLTDEEIADGGTTTVAISITNLDTGETTTSSPVAVTTTRSYITLGQSITIPAESHFSISFIEENCETYYEESTAFFAGSWTGDSWDNITDSNVFDMTISYSIDNASENLWRQNGSKYNGYVRPTADNLTAFGGFLDPMWTKDTTNNQYPHSTGYTLVENTWDTENLIWKINTATNNGYPQSYFYTTSVFGGFLVKLNGLPKNHNVWKIINTKFNGYPRIAEILVPNYVVRINTAQKLVDLFNGVYGWGTANQWVYVELTKDIDMNDLGNMYNEWSSAAFNTMVRWYFDGKNHSINNFYYCNMDKEFHMFGTGNMGGWINNVTFTDIYVRAYRITVIGSNSGWASCRNVHLLGAFYATGYIYLFNLYSAMRSSFNGMLYHLTNGDCYVYYCGFITDCSANVESANKFNFTIFRSGLNMRCWARLRNAQNCTMAYGTTAFSIFIPEKATGTVTIPSGVSVIYDNTKATAGNITISGTPIGLTTAEIQNAEFMASNYGFPYYFTERVSGGD